MSGLDVEGVLAGHVGSERGVYPGPFVVRCSCGDGMAHRYPGDAWDAHRAHVAAVLRAQIAAAMLDAWDRGWAARAQSRHGRYSLDHLDDPYRAELAALVAPSRVPEGQT